MSDEPPAHPKPKETEPSAAGEPSTSLAGSPSEPVARAAPAAADPVAPGAGEPGRAPAAAGPAPVDVGREVARLPMAWPAARIAGVVVFLVGGTALALMMANEHQLPRGGLIGTLVMLVATAGLLEALGVRLLDGARAAASLASVRSIDWKGLALHPATVAALVAAALFGPSIGRFALWDPWETHYGEVAREILARDDWVSLWWAQDGWFFSKPILIFWTEALSLSAFGVDFRPDANPASPELAIRLPVLMFSILAVALVATAVGRVWGRRAGILAGIVLATMPHFFLLSHQAITDMFFGASVAASMSCLILALASDPDRQAPVLRLGRVHLSARHAILGIVLLIAIPQILYLVTRNVTMVEGFRFAWHADRFTSGSAGNGDVPGNQPLAPQVPVVRWLQPILQGGIWAVLLAAVVVLTRKETRVRHLWLFAFYLFAALGFMGKGIPGIAVPGLVALLYLAASRRWSLLRELRIGTGILLSLVVAAPWFVACTVRHGDQFINRLLIHDHINRLAQGVHGDTGSVQYFLWQLGYSTFPWVALVPAAVVAWIWSPSPVGRPDAEARATATRLVALWFVASFSLFSIMITKFHHYVFPAVPPLAILVAVQLDRYMACAPSPKEPARLVGGVAAALAGAVALVIGIAGLLGDPRGMLPFPEQDPSRVAQRDEAAATQSRADRMRARAWNPVPCVALIGLGGLLLGAVAWGWRRRDAGEDDEQVAAPSTSGEASAANAAPRVVEPAPPPPEAPARAAEASAAAAAASLGQMALGAGIFVVGLGVTASTYLLAADSPSGGKYVLAYGAIAAGVIRFLTAFARWQGHAHARTTPSPALATGPVVSAGGAGSALGTPNAATEEPSALRALLESRWRSVALTVAALAGVLVVAFVGRDLSWVTAARPAGYERLIQLFVYNYDRPWPEQFDYGPILTGFAVAATVIVSLLAFRRLRAGAALALAACALVFTWWSLDVYLIDLSPHWSQGPTIRKYYEIRRGPHEEIIAFQMNWKGENFYTGNRVAVFVDLDTTALRRWAEQHRGQRHYFLTEETRIGGLRGALGNVEIEHVTTLRDNNKFVLVTATL